MELPRRRHTASSRVTMPGLAPKGPRASVWLGLDLGDSVGGTDDAQLWGQSCSPFRLQGLELTRGYTTYAFKAECVLGSDGGRLLWRHSGALLWCWDFDDDGCCHNCFTCGY